MTRFPLFSVTAARLVRLLAWVRRPEFLVFLPAITLAGFWVGGEQVLILLALGLPLLFAVTAQRAAPAPEEESTISRAIAEMDRILPHSVETGRTTACFVVQFDDLDALMVRHGRAAQADVMARTTDRLRGALRVGDHVAHLQGGSIAIVLSPVRRLDLETLVQMSARLQEAVAAPVSLGGAQVYVTCSIGFCLGARAPLPTGRSLLDAAQAAADEALLNGPGAIRAWSPDMARRHADRDALRDALEAALDSGQIRPHFQPQVSTDTGEVSGVEALARWHHPDRGCLSPAEFLPAVESGDLSERLSEVMLYHALTALAGWDKAGLKVPTVSVNFSAAELRNPRLPDRLKWELDRFDLAPQRLTVEVLETVVSSPAENDIVTANIVALADLGCGIDLDDFGTGHASITTIRRFAVRRLKIDRSFVIRIDQDREQQRLVAAVLSMAERLGLQTLAEGVETPGENAMLSQLGCGHVQGYGIARPMPLDEVTEWMTRHANREGRVPRIGLRGR